jgi:hypothetical protein
LACGQTNQLIQKVCVHVKKYKTVLRRRKRITSLPNTDQLRQP